MFRGVQHINMDAKGRLAMPARQREPLLNECSGQIVVTIDTQSACLVIYPLPEWERIENDETIIHIHGDKDHTLPPKTFNNDYLVGI